MASTKKKKILSKDELRRLMKQKQTTLKSTNRIEHPNAKYNSLNQLVCTVCNTTIKSDLLWPAHLQSRSHKERVTAKSLVGPAVPAGIKRPSADSDTRISENKKLKSQNGSVGKSGLPADFFDKSSKAPQSSNLLADYGSSSDDSNSDEEDKKLTKKTPGVGPPGLPSDFFDKGSKPAAEVAEEKPKTMADVLPEGFFDDPKMDAKVRNVEYRDKMEDEWESFQRAMKEESHVSEVIIEEDEEQATLERNIDEIDDQMNRWKEIDSLHVKKAEVIQKVADGGTQSDSEDELDDTAIEELFDWRAKKTWK